MRIVEAHILAAGQGYDQLLQRNGNGRGHGASAIAMLHPTQRIGLIAAFEPLYLALAQMQQAGGFAYAQPPACCIFNHLHSLELFLTHRHHPCRVTESRCSYGVTLSWSIYTPEQKSRQFPAEVILFRTSLGITPDVIAFPLRGKLRLHGVGAKTCPSIEP